MIKRFESKEADLHVLGIAGSLRRGSLNRRLLQAAVELAPEGMEVEPFELASVPLYNADLDTDEERPVAVRRLKEAVAEADGVLIATPEYNHGVPGVLQNAIDWVSRPAGRSPLKGKPVAIMGASQGAVGTARAQQKLTLVLLSTFAYIMPHPGILVANAGDRFDEEGRLTHEPTRKLLGSFLEQLAEWTARMGSGAEVVR
ncbi:MAG TPA: NAD(P)H-dependent oxidoreductase [Longimicrobiales bacterium]|nr:NAD(P)H-dependent oxidoreductase [Longimicrobiales bacterium]